MRALQAPALAAGRCARPAAARALPLLAWLALHAADARAQIDSAGVMDNILDRYAAVASTWADAVTSSATWLFWTLVVISMVWTFGMMALRKADIGDFFAEFVRFTIFTGLFWWALTNGPNFATSIYASLRQLAGDATGTGSTLAPSGIVDVGFAIFNKVLDQSQVWSQVDSMFGLLLATAILVILALVGVNMLLLLVSGWVLAYGGVFFLGFGGARWTSDIAISYYKVVIALAAQLMAVVLLANIGKAFLDDYYARMSAGISLKELGVMLIVCIILLALINRVPRVIAGIVTGASVSTQGIGQIWSGGATPGAAGMAVAAAATGGAALAAGAAHVASGTSAVMEAFTRARQDAPPASADMLAGFSAGPSATGGAAVMMDDGEPGFSAGPGPSPFAQAAGFAFAGSLGGGAGGMAPGPGGAQPAGDGGPRQGMAQEARSPAQNAQAPNVQPPAVPAGPAAQTPGAASASAVPAQEAALTAPLHAAQPAGNAASPGGAAAPQQAAAGLAAGGALAAGMRAQGQGAGAESIDTPRQPAPASVVRDVAVDQRATGPAGSADGTANAAMRLQRHDTGAMGMDVPAQPAPASVIRDVTVDQRIHATAQGTVAATLRTSVHGGGGMPGIDTPSQPFPHPGGAGGLAAPLHPELAAEVAAFALRNPGGGT
ncbi:P-type conjugative transfer protein TrbL [Ramlibacter sp. H39-3-26]|uniref:P-type conjugative transfer protein TrbL n=1 Tax=Curvibacter soli TaxID=3031331 RepID=UPI0023DC0CDE|nr:P-type conjugative transfer protein TrbL [Ramlibacter sp. H39-3-26]MDF1486015.1 P-type conjugative transfer protein TrbL [Ramlibacter sp. H39-3-26]